MMQQDGKIALGVLGSTAFNNQLVQNLLPYKLRVVPDNDKAGELFAQRITYAFSLFNKKVAVLKLPHSKDFCEYYLKTSKNATIN
jgi:DNA primase